MSVERAALSLEGFLEKRKDTMVGFTRGRVFGGESDSGCRTSASCV